MSKELTGDDLVKLNISESLFALTDNDRVARLAVVGIGRVLFRHHKNGNGWRAVFDAHVVEIRHVVDWLTSAVVDGDDWLLRVDSKERPLKLMKMHSIPQLVAEADKAFAKKMQKVGAGPALPGDERLHMTLADGYSIVRMLSPQALDRESSVMQHCVGLGSYDHHLEGDRFALYSLRDHLNRPHATMEVEIASRTLVQLRGKQNEMPVAKYLKALAPFVEAEGLNSGETAEMGFVIGKGSIVHHVSEIPDAAEFDRTLVLRGYGDDPEDIRLPSGIRVEGDLDIGRGFEGIFSSSATVSGDVHARGLNIPDISAGFRFGGGLHFEGSWVGDLPAGLHIRGDLVLKHCRKVVLPRGLVIDGDLDLTQADVEELPDDIVIRGNLHAGDSTLRRLPEGVSVGGAVFLGGTKQIEEIPAGFSVGGNLMLRDSSVRLIGEGVSVGGMVSVNAAIAAELEVDASAEIVGGLYFRPTAQARNFEGRSTMPADEFRLLKEPEVIPVRRGATFG
ncbi:PcfJ domain-containing protein [Pararhizobium sp. BT-229]|uniref:PcfJ domain-containing protein n=1 Tax=Pararhizobium sp. BT-229 TaxID=2986923 RepID=UPI0021F721FB|nr:PcfJ domain-containing protein [Pararhizobium sp. BT-229]MCV9963670.1 PcfJ domain-containing protein [Pararhizobium sp. BT-229]